MLKLSKRKILIILAERGLSLRQLAQMLGMTDYSFQHILFCKPNQRRRIVRKVATILGVTIEEIIGDE